MKLAKFDPRHYKRTKVVNRFAQRFQKYFLIFCMAKWNDFVGPKTALSTETLYGPYRSRTVDLTPLVYDPLHGKMERLCRSKDCFINRNPVRTMQKSHSRSLSNGRRNPLLASFSEHGMLDPVFSRDQWNQSAPKSSYDVYQKYNSKHPGMLQNHFQSD